jgi:hypothetical protein
VDVRVRLLWALPRGGGGSENVAGWAFHFQNNEKPVAPWGSLRSAYVFCACSINVQNAPGGSEMPQGDFRTKHKIKSFVPKHAFEAL